MCGGWSLSVHILKFDGKQDCCIDGGGVGVNVQHVGGGGKKIFCGDSWTKWRTWNSYKEMNFLHYSGDLYSPVEWRLPNKFGTKAAVKSTTRTVRTMWWAATV